MLDFSFTATQQEFRKQLRELALRELLPRYQQNDAEEHFPREQIKRIVRFGDEFWQGREEPENVRPFADRLVVGVHEQRRELDRWIVGSADRASSALDARVWVPW